MLEALSDLKESCGPIKSQPPSFFSPQAEHPNWEGVERGMRSQVPLRMFWRGRN